MLEKIDTTSICNRIINIIRTTKINLINIILIIKEIILTIIIILKLERRLILIFYSNNNSFNRDNLI
jgi:hypothetical protein